MDLDPSPPQTKPQKAIRKERPALIELPPPPPIRPLQKPVQTDFEEAQKVQMIRALDELLSTTSIMQPPVFRFEPNEEAAKHNFELLQRNNFQLEELLNDPPNSVTAYGSEFKDINLIEQLLGRHHRWPALKSRLLQGAEFPLSSLSEADRQRDFDAARQRGNHKSADRNIDFLASALAQEVEKGWALIVREEDACQFPNLELAPLGVAEHLGISATGEFVSKRRVTHDLSFPGAYSLESVNSRVLEEELEPCMFGHTLLRVIHRIVNYRL